MKNYYLSAFKHVLKRNNIPFNEEDIDLKKETPMLLKIGDNGYVFIMLQEDNEISLFSYVADLTSITTEKKSSLYEEALILNHFKWRSDLKFCLDENKEYLWLWQVINLSSEGDLSEKLNDSINSIINVSQRVQNHFEILPPILYSA